MQNNDLLLSIKDDIEALNNLMERDILDAPHMDSYKDMVNKKKEQYIISVTGKQPKIYELKDKRRGDVILGTPVMIDGKRKIIKCVTYEGLIGKLYDFYTNSGDNMTLEALFPLSLQWKSGFASITAKTLQEYKRIWTKYLEGYPISKTNIKKIGIFEWTDHYEKIIKEYALTKKQFGNIRNVVSMIMSFCINQRIINSNPTRDISYNSLPYKKSEPYNVIKATPFTDAQAKNLVKVCMEELLNPRKKKTYYYAIIVNLRLGLRYAETAALSWSDVDFQAKSIKIKDQKVLDYRMCDDLSFENNGRQLAGHMKAYEGARGLPMPEDIEKTLFELKQLNLSSDFVFPDGEFRYHTYNDKVKELAKKIGLNPSDYSSHSLRSTAATLLYLSTKDIYQVQALLGHTNPQMTMKYIKNILRDMSLKNSMFESCDEWLKLRNTAEQTKSPESV